MQWKHVVGQSPASDIGWDGRSLSSLAVDARGDIVGIATTITPTDPPRYRLTLAKLSGARGTLLWRRSLRYSTGLAVLALTPDGDVVAAGTIQRPRQASHIVVVGLDGQRGRRRWRRDVVGTAGPGDPQLPFDGPNALVVHPTGNVVLAGQLGSPGQGADFVVLALDAATGSERWRRQIDGEAHGDDGARALAVAGSDVIVVGEVTNVATHADAIAMALSAASGEERWRLECDASAVNCTPTSPR
jgi:outer membrane protein assembly factor BamB